MRVVGLLCARSLRLGRLLEQGSEPTFKGGEFAIQIVLEICNVFAQLFELFLASWSSLSWRMKSIALRKSCGVGPSAGVEERSCAEVGGQSWVLSAIGQVFGLVLAPFATSG